MKINERYVEALKAKYKSDILTATAGLALYLDNDNLSAIGEHSNLIEEQCAFISKIAEANDNLNALEYALNKFKGE